MVRGVARVDAQRIAFRGFVDCAYDSEIVLACYVKKRSLAHTHVFSLSVHHTIHKESAMDTTADREVDEDIFAAEMAPGAPEDVVCSFGTTFPFL